jgi:hypothetical protein
MAMGTPNSAAGVTPSRRQAARRSSAAAACANANSGVGVIIVCRSGSRRSMRAICAPTSSRLEKSPRRNPAVI